MTYCETTVGLHIEGFDSELQARNAYEDLVLKLKASFSQAEYGKATSGNGIGVVAKFDCRGTGNCIFEKLVEKGILDKATIKGVCVKNLSRTPPVEAI